MTIAQQKILRERRQYNQWVANETLEDYALRFTANKARKWSTLRVANTALGTVAFLVLEAVGATITLNYGFTNAVTAIFVVGAIIFALGLPVSYYAAKYGVDIDLLTRGAGFGYIGSTITSLIYASFTFIFFALEAAIMSVALQMWFGLPLAAGYLLSALVVIPLVTYGFTFLSRFQFWTQILWAILQLIPFLYIATHGSLTLHNWTSFAGRQGPADGHFDLLLFSSAASVVFALVPQNAEQVDFLRFLPRQRQGKHFGWWAALICAGPGWIVPGIIKMLVGSFFAVLLVQSGMSFQNAAQPARMYLFAFNQTFATPQMAIALAGIFVVISQLKINVTNAYAGSLAWSNFFSRLTHSHPGRVVWLFFNVTLAWLLMQLGIYETLERTLGLYSNIPVAWMGAIAADLTINKSLGLSPRHIEFKRAYLYDVNPVGVGAMLIASAAAIATYAGAFGREYHGLAPFVALGVSLVAAPLIAFLTGGRFYLARPRTGLEGEAGTEIRCCICEHSFEQEDMAHCPFYSGPICSLCCSLDARCDDVCKDGAKASQQWHNFLASWLPASLAHKLDSRLAKYASLFLLCGVTAAALLSMIYVQMTSGLDTQHTLVADTLHNVFYLLVIVAAIAVWPFILAKESSRAAREETKHQTAMLLQEIEAHKRTDLELQKAKELAEARSLAKSKYVRGISHELRTPLNAMLGYAQLLEANQAIPGNLKHSIRVIRRSGDHLSSLVDGLLDISMIEAGRLQIYRDEVPLAEFLDQIVDMFSLQARDNGLEFVFEAPKHMPATVYTDEKRLRQIIINLLSNAIRYTKQGKITLRIRYSNQVAQFDIEDTGIGIPPEELERIFQPFERIENPDHPTRESIGLGLTITRLLTEAMGGNISVKSMPAIGSCFSVRLMLSPVPATKRVREAVRQTIIGYEGKRRTILVVDDDPNHVAFVRDALSALDFLVVSETSGRGCLDAVARSVPDAILLDISMAGMGGWETAKRLRESPIPRMPIIMISADARLESQREASGLYHDAYLMKPLRISALLDSLKQLLELKWIHDQQDLRLPHSLSLSELSAEQIPSQSHLIRLSQLGAIGHIRGILAQLDEVGVVQPSAAPTLAYLRRLAEDCDLDGYKDTIEALVAHGP
ncbi:MAG TPA: ATP-binding protein [Micropepsaceae bacterium]|nr:ATP-binding protein [Micropepsaceae bacterium]